MKIEKLEPKTLSDGRIVTIYPASNDKRIYFAHIVMNGERYPAKGVAVNYKQTEAIYVIKGKFNIAYGGEILTLEDNDIIYFEEKEKYSLTGTGEIIVAVTPAKGGTTKVIDK